MNEFMKKAKEMADKGMQNKEGGPFGAVIVDKKTTIIAKIKTNIFLFLLRTKEWINTIIPLYQYI